MPPKRKSPASADKNFCAVCEEEVSEPVSGRGGDEAVKCEGICGAWLHRKCAGLTKMAFAEVCKSDNPFFCAQCKIGMLERKLNSVSSQLASVVSKLSDLRELMWLRCYLSRRSQCVCLGDCRSELLPAQLKQAWFTRISYSCICASTSQFTVMYMN